MNAPLFVIWSQYFGALKIVITRPSASTSKPSSFTSCERTSRSCQRAPTELVVVEPSLRDVRSKLDAHSSFIGNSAGCFARIRPEHVAERSGLWDLPVSLDFRDVFELDAIFREEASVNDKDLFVENVAESKSVESMREEVHRLVAVLSDDFSFESVELVHAPAFVVASVHVEAGWIHEFVDVEREDALHRKRSSVDEVSVEQVGSICRWLAVELEDVEQVIVLSMDVTADGEGLLAASGRRTSGCSLL